MKTGISVRIRNLFSTKKATPPDSSTHFTDVDLREEYANAFRTESYYDFWKRVLELTNGEATSCTIVGSTSADRLPSYRLFAEQLLDPDQTTVTRVLSWAKTRPETHSLLSDYFQKTADASFLFGFLLKDIDHVRVKFRSLKATIEALETTRLSPINHLPMLTRLIDFSNSSNPFLPSASSPCQFRAMQADCTGLLKRLELSRGKARAKLQMIKKLKHSSAVFLVAFTVSVTAIATTHALALLVAGPGLMAVSLDLASTWKLVQSLGQLDAAAKGTYILNRDLDTISRQVARLNDELEDVRGMVKFWFQRGEERLQAGGEVARQLKKNNSSFSQQLDDLEEHLYLCIMTINRARNLVIKEIVDPGRPIRAPNLLSA